MKLACWLGLMVVMAAAVACGDDDDVGSGGAGTTASSGGGTATGGSGGEGGGDGGDGGMGGMGSTTRSVTIEFAAEVDGAAFTCGTVYQTGMADTEGQLTDFRVYVHDLELFAGGESVPVDLAQDGVWQHENVALLDFEDKEGACANGTVEMNMAVVGTIPVGTPYDGLRFKLGVPFALNHQDASIAPSPLNLSAMFWNWQGGYKFLKADFVATGSQDPFNLHVGSTGCDGDPTTGGVTSCMRPNVATIELVDFDVDSDVVVVDYGAVMANSNLGAADAGGAPGCMSGPTDPECAPVFTNLGIDVATGATLSAQSLFSTR